VTRRRRTLVPRSVRARLTATYTLAAALLTVAGAAVFLFVLGFALRANLDSDLESEASTLSTFLRDTQGTVSMSSAGATPTRGNTTSTIVAYRTPSGQLLSASGVALPPLVLPDSFVREARRAPTHGTADVDGREFRIVAHPVLRPDGVWLAIAGASRDSYDEALSEVAKGLLVAGPAVILVVALGTWALSAAALRPVERMRRDAAELSLQPGGTRLSVPDTGDELAALAVTLNELLERLQRSLSRQRSLVADAGHELRTPLAVLRTELELADRPSRSREELAEAVSHAAIEADRLSQIADDLLFLARADEGESLLRPEPTDVSALLASAARAFRARAESANVALLVDVPSELPAIADPAALRRAIDNVLGNALEHSRSGGEIRLAATLLAADGPIVVSVTDTGPGFPPDFLPHAFERFRRADEARPHRNGYAGTGLGLAIVAEVAAAHGGHARAGNRSEGGASVELELPLRPPS
jgi:signal transduction histidine kinase